MTVFTPEHRVGCLALAPSCPGSEGEKRLGHDVLMPSCPGSEGELGKRKDVGVLSPSIQPGNDANTVTVDWEIFFFFHVF